MGCRVVSNLSTEQDVGDLEQVSDERKEISYIQETTVTECQLQSRNHNNIVELEQIAEQQNSKGFYPQTFSEPVSLQNIKIKGILRNSENSSSQRQKPSNQKNVHFSKKKRVKKIKRSVEYESKIYSLQTALQFSSHTFKRKRS